MSSALPSRTVWILSVGPKQPVPILSVYLSWSGAAAGCACERASKLTDRQYRRGVGRGWTDGVTDSLCFPKGTWIQFIRQFSYQLDEMIWLIAHDWAGFSQAFTFWISPFGFDPRNNGLTSLRQGLSSACLCSSHYSSSTRSVEVLYTFTATVDSGHSKREFLYFSSYIFHLSSPIISEWQQSNNLLLCCLSLRLATCCHLG